MTLKPAATAAVAAVVQTKVATPRAQPLPPPRSMASVGKTVETKTKTASVAKTAGSGGVGRRQMTADDYKKLSHSEQILLRPDTYIGSVVPCDDDVYEWILDETSNLMVWKQVHYVPGLFKIFDEILVNAADHRQRDPSMKELRVRIDRKAGEISVWNNGSGIPIEMHKTERVYVPELIFGHLLSGLSFDDTQERTTGGRNGYGAKLTNLFSLFFGIEVICKGRRYVQHWTDNMSKKSVPEITDLKKTTAGDSTKVMFRPDLARFGMQSLDDDIVGLFARRVYDIAGTSCDKKFIVKLNGKRVPVSTFDRYMKLYYQPSPPPPPVVDTASAAAATDDVVEKEGVTPTMIGGAGAFVCESVNERWQVGVGMSKDGFQQVSFVNGICTTQGGTHVEYILDQIVNHMLALCKRKAKGVNITKAHVKNNLWLFINAIIVNPSFNSQSKHMLTLKRANFGSECKLSEAFLKKVEKKTGILEKTLETGFIKAEQALSKQGGKKVARLAGIPKLDDANLAGTRQSSECTLILTEGDSAKALAVAGLSVVGRDRYGVFPLKGKLLNVRDAPASQVMKNVEFSFLKQILGLHHNKTYDDDIKSLRYGHVMIMADQDHDGSHIKGLLINLFATFWPSLLRRDGFLTEFITPIVKVSKGKRSISFYSIPEYVRWKAANGNGRGWVIKYYKGLGTSDAKEAKEYFSALEKHQIDFVYTGKASDERLEMAFGKKQADARKKWLESYKAGDYLEQRDVRTLSYSDFVDKELILFCIACNARAIPSLVDGLKPAQRKILYACFKRNLVREIKVGSLAGYVIEQAAYHHGEASLHDTIINMAQNFVGSNNINLLFPAGQFGTRAAGGNDAASARYIHTRLCAITRAIFHADDELVLKYLDDDGQSIEPAWYVPVLPMVLVNGCSGIGMGWSTDIPNYNPRDIVENLKRLLNGEKAIDMSPWYRGFKGGMTENEKKKGQYVVTGKIAKINDTTLSITELPLSKWTQAYKEFLEKELLAENIIKDLAQHHTDDAISFTITLETPEKMKELEDKTLEKVFKLTTLLGTTNMVLFNKHGTLHKYDHVGEVLQEFFDVRLEHYMKRKDAMLVVLKREECRLSNKARFVLAIVEGELHISNVAKRTVLHLLRDAGYDLLPRILSTSKSTESEEGGGDDAGEDGVDVNMVVMAQSASAAKHADDTTLAAGYDYLLSMAVLNLTLEKVNALKKQLEEKREKIAALEGTQPRDMWTTDLDAFLLALTQYEEEARVDAEEQRKLASKTKTKPPSRAPAKRAAPRKTDSKISNKTTTNTKATTKTTTANQKIPMSVTKDTKPIVGVATTNRIVGGGGGGGGGSSKTSTIAKSNDTPKKRKAPDAVVSAPSTKRIKTDPLAIKTELDQVDDDGDGLIGKKSLDD